MIAIIESILVLMWLGVFVMSVSLMLMIMREQGR